MSIRLRATIIALAAAAALSAGLAMMIRDAKAALPFKQSVYAGQMYNVEAGEKEGRIKFIVRGDRNRIVKVVVVHGNVSGPGTRRDVTRNLPVQDSGRFARNFSNDSFNELRGRFITPGRVKGTFKATGIAEVNWTFDVRRR